MDVIVMRAGLLVRRGWRATMFLAVLAGVTAAVAMTAWTLSRRADTAFDRFFAASEVPELELSICPPDVEAVDELSLPRCWAYDAVSEREVIDRLPEVTAAGRVRYTGLAVARAGEPERVWPSIMLVAVDGIDGDERLQIVEGRDIRPGPLPEIVINERLRDHAGIGVGDELDLSFWGPGELGRSTPDRGGFGGPNVRVRVVGVGRGFRDLAAATTATATARPG